MVDVEFGHWYFWPHSEYSLHIIDQLLSKRQIGIGSCIVVSIRTPDDHGVGARKQIVISAEEVVELGLRVQQRQMPFDWMDIPIVPKRQTSETGTVDDDIFRDRKYARDVSKGTRFKRYAMGVQIVVEPFQKNRRFN